jgi:hypothetical protein
MHDLKEAPLPWEIRPSVLFECVVLSSVIENTMARAVVFQGPRKVAEFIVAQCNPNKSFPNHWTEPKVKDGARSRSTEPRS